MGVSVFTPICPVPAGFLSLCLENFTSLTIPEPGALGKVILHSRGFRLGFLFALVGRGLGKSHKIQPQGENLVYSPFCLLALTHLELGQVLLALWGPRKHR